MPFIEDFAQQAAQQTLGAGLGIILGGINDRRQLRQQEKLQGMQIRGQKEMTDYQMMKQLEMWDKTNFSAQVAQLHKAGLNPALLYGKSGPGGATAAVSPGSITGAHAPTGGGEPIAMGMSMAQMGLLKAQRELIEAQTKKELAQVPVSEAQVPNIQADTENKILQQIIHKYTGKEMQETFERVKQPNRGIESKTYQDELEARQGIATTIYDLWKDGKLKDKANYEIEQLLLQNAKTRIEARHIQKAMDLLDENIKGAQLNNIILDLESRLQTETGIDKSSSGLLKILGRLFLKLTGR